MVPDRGSRRKMLIEPEDKPSALASQLLPEKAACSCVSLALFRLARVFERPCTKTMGAAPTAVTVNAAGRSVLVIGSCPVRLNARTLACEVLPGTPLRIALPTPFAWPVTTLKTGQTPGLLLLLLSHRQWESAAGSRLRGYQLPIGWSGNRLSANLHAHIQRRLWV